MQVNINLLKSKFSLADSKLKWPLPLQIHKWIPILQNKRKRNPTDLDSTLE